MSHYCIVQTVDGEEESSVSSKGGHGEPCLGWGSQTTHRRWLSNCKWKVEWEYPDGERTGMERYFWKKNKQISKYINNVCLLKAPSRPEVTVQRWYTYYVQSPYLDPQHTPQKHGQKHVFGVLLIVWWNSLESSRVGEMRLLHCSRVLSPLLRSTQWNAAGDGKESPNMIGPVSEIEFLARTSHTLL